MAGPNRTMLQTHLPNPNLSHLFIALEPKSLIFPQSPTTNDKKPNLFQLTTESSVMERGPQYDAYARLRESNLRTKRQSLEPVSESYRKQGKYMGTPLSERKGCSVLAKPVRTKTQFREPGSEPSCLSLLGKKGKFQGSNRKGCSVLAQSVPDFAAAVRKENRRPVATAMVTPVKTPVSSKGSKMTGGPMTRKSYATKEDLIGSVNGRDKRVSRYKQ